jgi:hypothetical protein
VIRTIIALSIVCVTASAALARDLCIQLDNGLYAGSALVLKKAKVTRRSVAPVQGYLARYSAALGSFTSFTPLYGQSVVNTAGRIAFGITLNSAMVTDGGAGNSSSAPQWISMTCAPQTGSTIRVLDLCATYISGTSVNAHVVDCYPEAAIP